MSLLAAFIGGGALACSLSDSSAPATTPSVQGRWSYHESYTDALNGLSCADSGTYDLVEAGLRFSGTYVQWGACHTQDRVVIDISDKGPVTDGQVSGRHILFKAPGCSYDGLIRVDNENHVEGNVVCSASLSGTTFHLSGTWFADR